MNENLQEQNQAPVVDQPVSAPKKGRLDFVKNLNFKKLIKPLAILIICVLLLGGISVLAYKNISLLVVGRVGNSFITRKELNSKLFETYGQNTLDEMVNEKIIAQSIEKSGIKYTQEELDAKIADIESQVQQGTGMSLDAYLESQNLPREDFEENIIMQLSLEKILTPELNITDEAIDTFLEQNGAYLTGDTEEAKRAEAVNALVDQELGTAFQTWLEARKTEIKVATFLD